MVMTVMTVHQTVHLVSEYCGRGHSFQAPGLRFHEDDV